MTVCLHLCKCACLVPMEPRRGLGFPRIGIVGGCDLPCGFWELTSNVLEMSLISSLYDA